MPQASSIMLLAYLVANNLSQVQSTLSVDSLNNDMLVTTVIVIGSKWLI